MRKGDSEAALASIAALQRRIRVLEYVYENLKQQSLRLQLVEQQQFFAHRHSALTSASDRSKEFLANLRETLCQISSVRGENVSLKDQVEQSEIIFRGQKQKNVALEQRLKEANADLNDHLSALSDNEALFGQILAPPRQSTVLSGNESLIIAATGLPEESISHEVLRVHKNLRSLPRSFRKQDLATKNAIVQALTQAKDMCEDLLHQIRILEKGKRDRGQINGEIKHLAKQQCLLSHDIMSFKFH
jgi:hypothetical protein